MESITVHCMVRNEPFIYYSVKSVYDYVGTILLYDTGSYDKHTLSDIKRLLDEDCDHKIKFEQVKIEVDETKWTASNWQHMKRQNIRKRGTWMCRQKQIDDTKTKFFMVLDGDEVWYRSGMQDVLNCVKRWPANKVCGFVPLTWFSDIKHTFMTTHSGRIFVKNRISVTRYSPGELHQFNGRNIKPNSDCSFNVLITAAYAHFEAMLKPWRRTVPIDKVKVFDEQLPEVMMQDMSLVERFQNELVGK